jgi:hypothetical protein
LHEKTVQDDYYYVSDNAFCCGFSQIRHNSNGGKFINFSAFIMKVSRPSILAQIMWKRKADEEEF